MASAEEYLEKVTEKAKEMYEISNQGAWDDLEHIFQRMWISSADEMLKEENGGKRG